MAKRRGILIVMSVTMLSALTALPALAAQGMAALPAPARAGSSGSDLISLSCPSAGNCAAGGYHVNGSGLRPVSAFVLNERAGRWGKAQFIPGMAAARPYSQVNSVSCATAGNCAAGGSYDTATGYAIHAFVDSERNGRWVKIVTLHKNGQQFVNSVDSVSCPAPGYCAATGSLEGFLASEVRGRWGQAFEIPGLASLSSGGGAEAGDPLVVSCGSAGNCVAGGSYAPTETVFVVSQKNGRWGQAMQLPGMAALGAGGAAVTSLSCPSAGNCSVAGWYYDSSGGEQVFVAGERNGHWGKAIEVPGFGALNTAGASGRASINSVSCASAGNCSAGGFYETHYGYLCGVTPSGGIGQGTCQAFVVSEKNGRWGKAIEVPGTAALDVAGAAAVTSVSCTSAGNCIAGGYYAPRRGHQVAFVVTERNGRWGRAIKIPGLASLDTTRYSQVNAVSCGMTGNCAAGGFYDHGVAPFDCPGSPGCLGFVVNQRHGIWGRARTVRF